jgi:hypothetical protein
MKKLIVFAIAILGFTAVSFGQLTANATASGTVLAATSISKNVGADLNFGTFIPGTSAGTVVVSPAGARTQTSPVVLAGGTVAAAAFTISGTGTDGFTITLPDSHTITRTNGAETMTVNTFTSTPSGTGTLVAGTKVVTVGATLQVGTITTNPAGLYTNPAGFEVTIAWN